MILNSPYITGSLTVTGDIVAQGGISISGSIESASYSANSDKLDNLDSTSFVYTSSYNLDSSSFSTRVVELESTASILTTASASFAIVSSSFSTTSQSMAGRISIVETSYATTGSNSFVGSQQITGSLTISCTIIAQALNVQQVTSSIVYSCGSNQFGCALSDVQQFTGSVSITGSLNVNGTSAVTGTGTSGQVSYFTGTSSITGESNLFWDATNDRLGIGTTSPTNKINILNNGNSIIAFRIDDTNANGSFLSLNASNSDAAIIANGTSGIPLDFYTGGSKKMTLDSSGNLGLGVTPSAWGDLYGSAIQVRGGSILGFSTSVFDISQNAYADNSTYRYVVNGAASQYRQESGSHKWYNVGSGTAGCAITFTQAMTLDACGRLGIGVTTNFNAPLTVQSNSGGVGVHIVGRSADGFGFLTFRNNANNAINGEIGISDAQNMLFYTGATVKLTISCTGAATFSSSVTAGQYNASSKYAWGTATDGTTGQIATDNTNNYFDYIGNLYFRGAAASNTLITFTNAGAATFSSSVTAASLLRVVEGGFKRYFEVTESTVKLYGGNNPSIKFGDYNTGVDKVATIGFEDDYFGRGALEFTVKGQASGTGITALSIASTGAATFSSSVTATQGFLTATANTYAGGALRLTAHTGGRQIFLTSVGTDFALSNGGSADHLIIASTGAATFSSSVTASNFYSPGGTGFWSDSFDVRRNGFVADGTNLIFRAGTSSTGEQTRLTISQSTGAATFSSSVTSNSFMKSNAAFTSYTEDGLFSANATYSAVITPGGSERIRFGYFDYGGGQYYGRIGFQANTNWSLGTIGSAGNDFSIGVGASGQVLTITSTSISCFSGTVCAPCFATISDYRMKSNLQPIDGLSIIMNTKPYKFNYNYDCSTSFGMIAHELQDVLPEAVFGHKDGEVMQGVDYMKLLPIAIKAIQELKQQIDILKQS